MIRNVGRPPKYWFELRVGHHGDDPIRSHQVNITKEIDALAIKIDGNFIDRDGIDKLTTQPKQI